jgi:hypothetical protein
MLIIDEAAAQALSALPTPRQRHLAMDFAANRRFRRDVFVRDEAQLNQRDAADQLNTVVIGCLGDPLAIPAAVRVPRGEIRFQDDFIAALRQLMHRGSMPLGDAVGALAGQAASAIETTRNLVFLVAAGVLAPFAQPFRRVAGAANTASNATVLRALQHAQSGQSGGILPSAVAGNGVPVSAAQAAAILARLAGDTAANAAIEAQIDNLTRLGVLV